MDLVQIALEGAMLMALTQGPVRLDPELHPKEALRARNHMLERFLEAGLITEGETETAKLQPLGARPR